MTIAFMSPPRILPVAFAVTSAAVLRARSPINIAIAFIGAALLVFTVQRVGGWGAVVEGITSIGGWFLAVVMLGAGRMAAKARAWMLCARASGAQTAHLTFRRAYSAVLAGDAAGNLTPLGVLASEPTKILMTRQHLSTVTAIASVAIENAFYMASVGVVLLAGTWILLQRADVPAGLEQISEAIVLAVAIALVTALWAARARPKVLSRLAPYIARLAGRSDAPADALRAVESKIYGALHWPPLTTARIVLWEAAFHAGAVAEVWLVLRLLPGGDAVALVEAFLMESAGRFVTVAFKFVPYRLGIDEIGSGAVAQVLGLPPAAGVTLALVRRLRILVLNAVGVVILVRR
jgi:hypothetical protein